MCLLTRWAAATILLVCASPGWSQTLPTLRSETRAVQIDVVATDSHGRPVGDLTKEDFTVLDNGKPREIQIFSIEGTDRSNLAKPAPPDGASAAAITPSIRTTVLLMDAINDYFDDHVLAWKRAVKYVENLPPGERMALYVLDQGIRILQSYTTDRELLLKAIRAYRSPPLKARGIGGKGGGVGRGVPSMGGGGDDVGNEDPLPIREFKVRRRATDTLDAFRAIANRLATLPGRKNLIWLSAGFPPAALRELDAEALRATAAMNEANVALYAVDARGLMATNGDTPNISTLQELAVATGGKAYHHRNDIERALSEAGDDTRVTYTLGFYVPEQERDGKFHELRVRAVRPHIDLRYRKGYYAGTEQSPDRKQKPTALEDELLNPLDATGVGISLRLEKLAGERPSLRLHFVLDSRTVTLTPDHDGWSGKVEHLFAEFDDKGVMVARFDDSGEFRVTAGTRPQFERIGAAYARDIPLHENAVRLHVIVRDTASGRIGSLTVPIPNARQGAQ